MKDEVDLWVGNGARVAALAIGTYYLTLPSRLVLQLSNYYYVPTMSKNIISVSCLDNNGFHFIIKNNNLSIYHGDIFYGVATLSFGLYVLNLEQSKRIYNINDKMLKLNDLNQTYVWHCHLGHANEKSISQLHRDGLLDSFDFESFDTWILFVRKND